MVKKMAAISAWELLQLMRCELSKQDLVKLVNFHVSQAHEEIIRLFDGYDPDVFILMKDNTYLAGGAIVSTLLDEPIKDFDFYCENQQTVDEFVTRFTDLQQKRIPGVDIHITDNAISFKRSSIKYPYYQIIRKISGNSDDVIQTFDWVHCMVWFKRRFFSKEAQYPVGVIGWNDEFYEVVKDKLLRANPNYKGELSGARFNKFLRRGWRLESPEEYGIKILQRLNFEASKDS